MSKMTNVTRTKLLKRLSDGQFHSGETLGVEFGISRASISKHVKALSELGLDIFSVTGKGYKLAKPLSLLGHQQIAQRLSELNVEHVEVLNIIDSTNNYMKQKVRPIPNGYVCLAEAQTAGRGRLGRTWVSPYGASIYLSMFWSFKGGYQAISGLSLAVGMAVVQALQTLEIKGAKLKWPNDIYLQGKKLAGILVEAEGQLGAACDTVIGIGLNINLPESKVDIDQAWIDLNQATDNQFDRNELAATIINKLFGVLTVFEKHGLQPFIEKWQQLDYFHEKEVKLLIGDKQIKGIVKGINQEGALMLQQGGKITAYHGGEISVRPA
jgi:BirA family biotin operon repressor/biotin-[acetyl-CoA-carboxylase] ligase